MTRRPRRHRDAALLLRAVAITAAASALITPSAAAHDGETEFITEIDGYYVEVTDNIVPDAGLFYTVFLRRLDRGLPVDNASVEITARSDTITVGPTPTARLANAYSVLIPDNGVSEWTIDVRIEHATYGITAFSHPLRGVAADDPWWTSTPVLVVAWTLPVVGLFVLHRAGNRRRAQDARS